MEKHLTVADYINIIDMINATEEDIEVALGILASYNRFSTYLVSMNFNSKYKKRILNNIGEHESLNTSIKAIYWLLKKDKEFEHYEELFKHIVLERLKNASKQSNLDKNIKHIKTKLNV